jgi:signal peptide peptidase SppA
MTTNPRRRDLTTPQPKTIEPPPLWFPNRRLLLHRFCDVPLLIHPRVTMELFDAGIRQIVAQSDDYGDESDDGSGYYMAGSVAVIPIKGILVNGPTYYFDETSYSDVIDAFDEAESDDGADAIAFQISSPGGEASGLFDLVDHIFESRGNKPLVSIIDDTAFSAAYAIAAASDKVYLPSTGNVGGVGVITMHADITQMLENMGIKISLVAYGERKADYSPFKPLSDSARGRLQTDVNMVGEIFVDSVARGRGMTTAKVKQTEAATFMGAAGVEAGFADAVLSPQAAFADLVAAVSTRRLSSP